MQKKISLKKAFYVALLCLIIIVCNLIEQTSFYIRTRAENVSVVEAYENTNVYDDLTNSTVGGNSFNILEYPYNPLGKAQIIAFIEFCYSHSFNEQDDYGLYIYVYNPRDIAFDTTAKNTISFSCANTENYEEYALRFLNYSTEPGYEGRFYKFKIDLTTEQRTYILNELEPDNRVYKVIGFELSYKNKVTDYKCAQNYTYTGFSTGYGSELAESDSLSCKVDGFAKYLTLDVHSTVWRSSSSSKGIDYSNQLNSVYFSVPNKYLEEYGSLHEIKAEWYEYQTDWITVTTNNDLYSYMLDNMGRKYYDYDSNGNKVDNYDTSSPYCIFGWDNITPTNSSSAYLGRFNYGYELNKINSDSYVKNASSAFHYAFHSDKSITEAVVDSETLTDWIYTYKDKYDVDSFLDVKDGKSIPAELFTDTVDDGRTRGYNCLTISSKDKFSLLSYNENHNFWDKVKDLGFWNTLKGDVPEDSSIYIDTPILQIDSSTYSKLSKTAYVDEFLINSADVDDFDEYLQAAWKKKETPILFRFAVTDYYRAYGNALTGKGASSDAKKQTLYGAKETVFFDFDIIQLTFLKDGVFTVIPVVSSPIDIIGGIEPPPIGDDDWWKIILCIILACLLLIILLQTGLLPFVLNIVTKIILLPFKLVAIVVDTVSNNSNKNKKE